MLAVTTGSGRLSYPIPDDAEGNEHKGPILEGEKIKRMSLHGVDLLSFGVFSDAKFLISNEAAEKPDNNCCQDHCQSLRPIMAAAVGVILRDRVDGVDHRNKDRAYDHRDK